MARDNLSVLLVTDAPAADTLLLRSLAENPSAVEGAPAVRMITVTPEGAVAHLDRSIAAVVLDDLSPSITERLVREVRESQLGTPILSAVSRHRARLARGDPALGGAVHQVTREDLRPSELYGMLLFAHRTRETGPSETPRTRSILSTLDLTGDGIWDWDLRRSTVTYSATWKRLIGYEVSSIGNSPDEWLRRVHPADVDRHRDRLTQFLSDESGGVFESEYRLLHRDGEYRWMHCRAGICADADGSPHLVGVQRDVHDRVRHEVGRRRSEQHRRHVEKMDAISRLAGGIAHDFNNLLVVILGYSDFILSHTDASHPFHSDVLEIKKAGEQARELTQQLLSFGGRQEAEAENLDLVRLSADAVPVVRRIVGEEVDVALRTPSGPLTVRVESSRLRQAIVHMVVHARDLLEGRGVLEMAVEPYEAREDAPAIENGEAPLQLGSYARMVVVARGRERPTRAQNPRNGAEGEYRSDYVASRFDPDLPLVTPERYGFGLSVVKQLAESADGGFDIDHRDGDTVMTLYLPRIHPERAAIRRGPAFAPRAAPATIVLVEDNAMVRSLVRHILVEQGYRVLVAGSGEEAMHICAEHRDQIDLLLTDVVMPRVGGRELADRLQGMLPGLRVLYMSGFTGDQLSEHGVDESRAFIPKPFTSEELGFKVREILNGAPGPKQ